MPYYLKYLFSVLSHIPCTHWIVMGIISLFLTVSIFIRNKSSASVYGAIDFGATVFISLIIFEMTVVTRYTGIMPHGYGFDFVTGFYRLFHGGEQGWREIITNIVVFVPFGFFLTGFMSSMRRLGIWSQIGYVALAAFVFSLCIESLQLILNVGFFELTDLLMNTLGAIIGAGVSFFVRLKNQRREKKIGDD